jgi:hypothetical protein
MDKFQQAIPAFPGAEAQGGKFFSWSDGLTGLTRFDGRPGVQGSKFQVQGLCRLREAHGGGLWRDPEFFHNRNLAQFGAIYLGRPRVSMRAGFLMLSWKSTTCVSSFVQIYEAEA